MNVGLRIKELREQKGYSVNKLANMAGVSQSYLRDIEQGNKNPTVSFLSLLCEQLGITLKDFFNDTFETQFFNEPLIKKIYQLSEGVNLIGRMTVKSAPEATIPITTGDMGFSRKHLNIEVVKESSDTIKYYMYNAANKNLTTVNGISLLGTDKVILHDGDIIRSSATELVFKLR